MEPLASGFLSGRAHATVRDDEPTLDPARPIRSLPSGELVKLEAAERLGELAADIGCSLPDLAVAFAIPTGSDLRDHRPTHDEQLDSLLAGPG